MSIKEVFKLFSDIVYPRRCPICYNVVVPKNGLSCIRCKHKLTVISEPRCMKCSKPIQSKYIEYCFDCSNKAKTFNKGYALWIYDDLMKKSIGEFKYNGKKEYADFYANMLFNSFQKEIIRLQIEAFIPVPIHNKKKNIRGYNQATVLANKLSELTLIPVIDNVLIRDIYTTPQKELNDVERRKNMENAFVIKENNYFYNNKIKNLMLIDDIYTTGSTIEFCTRKLVQAGACNVYFLCICIGLGN